MLNLFKRARTTSHAPVGVAPKLTRAQALELFYSRADHQWIAQNKYIKGNFEDFFEFVPTALLNEIVVTHEILFVNISARYSCAIGQANVVLVFPELYELLASTAISTYKAILAHEIGHIVGQHGSKSLSVIEAQVEADGLAVELGFIDDLETFLLEQPESIEKRIRLSYLTTRYYNKVNE